MKNYELKGFGTKKEIKEMEDNVQSIAEDMSKHFLKGLTFFITVPIDIYNFLKRRRR